MNPERGTTAHWAQLVHRNSVFNLLVAGKLDYESYSRLREALLDLPGRDAAEEDAASQFVGTHVGRDGVLYEPVGEHVFLCAYGRSGEAVRFRNALRQQFVMPLADWQQFAKVKSGGKDHYGS